MLYFLGVRERTDKRVRELVLDDPAPFVPFFLTKRGHEVEYQAKAVTARRAALPSSAAITTRRARTPPTGSRSWPASNGI